MKKCLILLVTLTLLSGFQSVFADSILDTAKSEMLNCTLRSAKSEAIRRGYDHVNQRSNRHQKTVEQETKRVTGRCALRAIDFALNVRTLLKD
jgi:hypothetical protein